MPPALILCLALIGALFSGAVAGVAYGQMQLGDPERDGYFRLQSRMAEAVGLKWWARVQRSAAARRLSFGLALAATFGLVAVALWQGLALILP